MRSVSNFLHATTSTQSMGCLLPQVFSDHSTDGTVPTVRSQATLFWGLTSNHSHLVGAPFLEPIPPVAMTYNTRTTTTKARHKSDVNCPNVKCHTVSHNDRAGAKPCAKYLALRWSYGSVVVLSRFSTKLSSSPKRQTSHNPHISSIQTILTVAIVHVNDNYNFSCFLGKRS